MTIDPNDNLYILEDEELNDKDYDNSPRNFASYNDEDREVESVEELDNSNISPFGLLIKIMFNPVEGWKKLRRNKLSIEILQSKCFYPLLALLAISKFAEFFYSVNVSISSVITSAVIIFVAYFFGYFSIPIVLSWVLNKDTMTKFDEGFGKEYIIISLSSLAIFSIMTDFLPMIWPILIFLPIWTLYIMFKGVRFFKLPKNQEIRFYIFSGVSVIGIPMLIEWVLNSILPY